MSIIRSQKQESNLEAPTKATLDLVLNCAVTKLNCSDGDGTVNYVETGKGVLKLANETNVILCAGVGQTIKSSFILDLSIKLISCKGCTKCERANLARMNVDAATLCINRGLPV